MPLGREESREEKGARAPSKLEQRAPLVRYIESRRLLRIGARQGPRNPGRARDSTALYLLKVIGSIGPVARRESPLERGRGGSRFRGLWPAAAKSDQDVFDEVLQEKRHLPPMFAARGVQSAWTMRPSR